MVTINDLLNGIANDDVALNRVVSQILFTNGHDATKLRETAVPLLRSESKDLLRELLRKHSQSRSDLTELVSGIERYLELDTNWATAVLCFAAGDFAIQQKAKSMGISLSETRADGMKVPRNAKKLLDEIIKKSEQRKTRLKNFNNWNEDYRNDVIHRGEKVNQKDAEQIKELTLYLLDDFFGTPSFLG